MDAPEKLKALEQLARKWEVNADAHKATLKYYRDKDTEHQIAWAYMTTFRACADDVRALITKGTQ